MCGALAQTTAQLDHLRSTRRFLPGRTQAPKFATVLQLRRLILRYRPSRWAGWTRADEISRMNFQLQGDEDGQDSQGTGDCCPVPRGARRVDDRLGRWCADHPFDATVQRAVANHRDAQQLYQSA